MCFDLLATKYTHTLFIAVRATLVAGALVASGTLRYTVNQPRTVVAGFVVRFELPSLKLYWLAGQIAWSATHLSRGTAFSSQIFKTRQNRKGNTI